ncbi:hypothetical protein [Xanthomonas graminis]|uniref:hypothetical protein n=1 Tax=Xanthomonas graminis TaxID=3390026 RepID=UPI001F242A1F|nr:hypothetical protein [Xanthomonas translucens]UKE72313.1 hypothetical protein KFS85_14775 [Xanthomonas translucens pv. phleipratensis]
MPNLAAAAWQCTQAPTRAGIAAKPGLQDGAARLITRCAPLLRLLGAGCSRRHFYLSASAYLWVNAAVTALYNRVELGGLPWWGGVLIDLSGAALVLAAALPRGRWLRRARPSVRGAELIAAFAPIVFSLAVLLLAISVSRVSFF